MAEGDIGAVIDTLTFNATRGDHPEIVKLIEGLFAIAYGGPDSDGWISSITIDDAGNISAAPIDNLEFQADVALNVTLLKVADDMIAVAFSGPGTDGFVITAKVNADGSIDDAVVDSLEYDTSYAYQPHMIALSETAFVVVGPGAGSQAWVYSFTITPAGAISDAVLDSLAFIAGAIAEPKIIQVNANVCATVYRDSTNKGTVATLPVNAQGTIGDAVIDTLDFEATSAWGPYIVHVFGQIYAVVYADVGSDGWLKTFSITAAGVISDAVIDSYEFDPLTAGDPVIVHISGTTFAILYTDGMNDLWLKTITIDTDGTITPSFIDTLELDAADGQFVNMIHVTGNIYAVVYTGTSVVGKVLTVDIETTPEGFPRHLMLMGIG